MPFYFLNKYLPIWLLPENQNFALALGSLTSAWVAIVISIISMIALYVAYKTLSEQRLNNNLTVRPLPEITIDDNDDELCIKLVNHGFGPLLIKTFISTNPDSGKSGKSLADCVDLCGNSWTRSCGRVDGRVILPGKEIVLVELKKEKDGITFNHAQNHARNDLSNVKIVVCYSDIYDSKLPPYERVLSLPDNSKYLE